MNHRLFLFSSILVGACADTSQIVLSIDTAVGVPCAIDEIRVRATGSEDTTTSRSLEGARLPIAITLEDDTSDGGFDLVVGGYKDGAEVLRSVGSLQFGPGAPLSARVVLESTCTPDQPCAVPALEPFVAPPAPVARSQCGEAVERYIPGPATEAYRDACTVPGANAGKVLTGGEQITQLPLGAAALESFGFELYGQPVRQIWVSKNGYASFAPDNPDEGNDLDSGSFDRNLIIMGVPPPQQAVFPFWDDLTLGPDGVCFALEGNPGTQKLRITWKNACHTLVCSPTNSLNFTIVLDERTNRVSFTYGDMVGVNVERAQGSTATSGIVNRADGCRASECEYATGLCADGVTACGYSQTFSETPQTPRVMNVQFDPVRAADQ